MFLLWTVIIYSKMWLSVMCILVYMSAKSVASESFILQKCCPNDQSLIKVFENNQTLISNYECVSRQDMNNNYSKDISQLIISEDVIVQYGMPLECKEIQELKTEKVLPVSSVNNSCYDKLALEIKYRDLIHHVSKTIGLTCQSYVTDYNPGSGLNINRIRKCCPRDQAYDHVRQVCSPVDENDSNDEWMLNQITTSGPYIYDVDIGLRCKLEEYNLDLIAEDYSLDVHESRLIVSGDKVFKEQRLAEGEWCMDRRKIDGGLIARVCASNATVFGAYPIRKCCPIGQHFKVRGCHSMKSDCVPNTEDAFLFNVSYYLDPLKEEYSDFPDLLGIRTEIICTYRKYVVRIGTDNPLDDHHLNIDGSLQQLKLRRQTYCVEEFDRRQCEQGQPIEVAAALCFEVAPELVKDFFVSFLLISISAVCLALTLVVYCWLPELRNLHGRTLICHVSTMLLAFVCLARVQYGTVEENYCVFFGYSIYFGFVAAFAWLNVMCLDIWWTFGSVRTVHPLRKTGAEARRFLWYSLYAWSLAVLMTLTMFLLDKYPVAAALDANIGHNICWFGSFQNTNADWPHYIFFVVPMGLITCTNFVLWVLTARHCARVKSEVHRLQAGSVGDRAKRTFRVDRAKYILTGKLWVVMGAGWMAELLSTVASEPKWFWQIVDIINAMQGIFIFIILIMKPKLYYLIRKRLGCSRIPIDPSLEKPDARKNGTSSSARTSSTFLSRTISTDERTNLRISLPSNVKQA